MMKRGWAAKGGHQIRVQAWIGMGAVLLAGLWGNAALAQDKAAGAQGARSDVAVAMATLHTRLQQRLRVLLTLLDEDAAASMVNAQLAWRNYRDETCTVEASAIAPRPDAKGLVEYTRRGCERRMGERRLIAINRYIAILQGKASYAELTEREPQLYVIGVYEGRVSDTARGGHAGDEIVLVHVRKRSHPLILSLSAYAGVHWKLVVDPGVVLRKLILTGYHAQTLSGLPAGVDVVRRSEVRNGEPYYYAYKKDDQYFRLSKYLKGLTGLDVSQFQGRYKGGDFVVE